MNASLRRPADGQDQQWSHLLELPATQAVIYLFCRVTIASGVLCLAMALLMDATNRAALLVAGFGQIAHSIVTLRLCDLKRFRAAAATFIASEMVTLGLVRMLSPDYTDANRTLVTFVLLILLSVAVLGPRMGRAMVGLSIFFLLGDTIIRAPSVVTGNPNWLYLDMGIYPALFVLALLVSESIVRALATQITLATDSQKSLAAQNSLLKAEAAAKEAAQADLARLVDGLQSIVAAASELFACETDDLLWRRAVELPREKLGVERCAIFLWQPGTGKFEATYGTDIDGHTANERGHFFQPPPEYLEQWRNGQAIRSDVRHRDWRDGRRREHGHGWVARTPVLNSSGELVALMFNDAALTGAPADPHRQELIKVYCSVLGAAIDRLRLEREIRQGAALEERSRLARELHDSVSQALFGIVLGTRTALERFKGAAPEQLAPLHYVLNLADGGLAEMRALIYELRPESLAQEGLIPALQKQADALAMRHNLALAANLGELEPDLHIDVKEALYRVTVEAIQNIVKHAKASTVELRLDLTDRHAVLSIGDNGRGFDVSAPRDGHYGLTGMRERVERVGGRLDIDSAPGQGTRLRIEAPLQRQPVSAVA